MFSVNYLDVQKTFKSIRDKIKNEITEEMEIAHLYKLSNIIRIMYWIGIFGMPIHNIFINIIAVISFSIAITMNWTIMAHHTLHRGFVHIKDSKFHSKKFARGFYRLLHFPDWLHPPSWSDEHNRAHHYMTNELGDPDLVENKIRNLQFLPKFIKYILLLLYILTWKFTYYSHNIIRIKINSKKYKDNINEISLTKYLLTWLSNLSYILFQGYFVYLFYLIVIIPTPFYIFGYDTFIRVMINVCIAEILSNIHSFIIIAPNHCGSDIYRFKTGVEANSGEFYFRQILCSVNYNTGNFIYDFLYGYLNYQIEHHIFPNESPLVYTKLQPEIKKACEELKIRYVQENVFIRLYKLSKIWVGDEKMLVWDDKFNEYDNTVEK